MVQKFPKNAIIIDYSRVSFPFLSVKKLWLSACRSQSKTFHLNYRVSNKNLLRLFWYWSISFCDPHIEEMPEKQLVLNFLQVAPTSLQIFSVQFLSLDLNRKPSTCTRELHWKNIGSVPCIRRLMVRRYQKANNFIDCFRYANFWFSKTTGLISFIKFSIRSIIFVEAVSIENPFSLIIVSDSW